MIPVEVENRIAKYFFHRYLPDEIMIEVESKLLSDCVWIGEQNLDQDKLVHWAIEIIDSQLENKRLK